MSVLWSSLDSNHCLFIPGVLQALLTSHSLCCKWILIAVSWFSHRPHYCVLSLRNYCPFLSDVHYLTHFIFFDYLIQDGKSCLCHCILVESSSWSLGVIILDQGLDIVLLGQKCRFNLFMEEFVGLLHSVMQLPNYEEKNAMGHRSTWWLWLTDIMKFIRNIFLLRKENDGPLGFLPNKRVNQYIMPYYITCESLSEISLAEVEILDPNWFWDSGSWKEWQSQGAQTGALKEKFKISYFLFNNQL